VAATVPLMAARTLDITALTCPMTWVRTKLELERMAPGEELEVRCRPGEALENVPRSAREAGHDVAVEGTTIRIVPRRKPVTSTPGEAE
jgi:TusA-related sulfurtransferase